MDIDKAYKRELARELGANEAKTRSGATKEAGQQARTSSRELSKALKKGANGQRGGIGPVAIRLANQKKEAEAQAAPEDVGSEPDLIGARLRWARGRVGYSSNVVGTAAGMSGAQLCIFERGGQSPRILAVERIAEFLKMRPAWLAFGEGAPGLGTATLKRGAHLVGQRLRSARDEKKTSLRELEAASGTSRTNISDIENGRRRGRTGSTRNGHGFELPTPSVEVTEKLAARLDVRAAWLAFGETPKERS